jgi:glycosyltransferase involved in cell wall biosynthesis
MKKLIFCVSSEMTLHNFLVPHLRKLADNYGLVIVANTFKTQRLTIGTLEIPVLSVPIERKLSPIADIRAFLRLVWLIRKEKPIAIHSITPKAGLLTMIAGAINNVPVRVHTFTGQVWVSRNGLLRWLLKTADFLTAKAATFVLVDSTSQRSFLINEGIITKEKSAVLGNGSICGVDIGRFRPDPQQKRKLRQELHVGDSDILFLYLGRINRDKGTAELGIAFANLSARYKNIHLLLVGPDEGRIIPEILARLKGKRERVHYFSYTNTPERYYAASDVFCLPSHREGFGLVIIEAAACGLPTVASRIYGITDAIEEGKTGLLHLPGNVFQLEDCLEQMMEPSLRLRMGAAARDRAISLFNQEIVVGAMEDMYRTLVTEAKVTH